MDDTEPVTSSLVALHSGQLGQKGRSSGEAHLKEAIIALGDASTGGYAAALAHLREAAKELNDARAERVTSVLSRHTPEWLLTKREAAELRNTLNDLLENRPMVKDPVEKRFLNVLVVGESGLGKSTFLQTFFNMEDVRKEVVRERTTEVISPIGMEIKKQTESGAPFQIRLFDSAGWGDELSVEDKITDIVHAILQRNEEYDNDRRAGKPDVRFHCCFYFIAPHRCKGVDVAFMQRLSRHIIVVPIIAKADAMTIEETARFKEIIDAQLTNIRTYPFDPPPLADGRRPHKAYAIIGSDGIVEELPCSNPACQGGRHVGRGRRYNWGTAFVRNPMHSDFVRLETEVFANYGQLIEAANENYNRWLHDRTKLRLERWLSTASRYAERHCIKLLFLMALIIVAVSIRGWVMWCLIGLAGAFVLLWIALACDLHSRLCTRRKRDFERVANVEEEEVLHAI